MALQNPALSHGPSKGVRGGLYGEEDAAPALRPEDSTLLHRDMPPEDPFLNQGHRHPVKLEVAVQGQGKVGEKLIDIQVSRDLPGKLMDAG